MELQFKKNLCPCLDTVLREVQNQEQTLEIKLPEGMPDVGRIVSAWGQGILRSKEWRDGVLSLSGGMQVWVLYSPEDGTQARFIDSWIPFQMRWDVAEEAPEGALRIMLLPRFVDARSVSPRKIMIRSGIGAMAQALSPVEVETYAPEQQPEGVELLKHTYPLRLPREAGEKAFLLDEELNLPASVPEAEELLYYRLQPKITDQKVLGNKLVFRGTGNLHVLYTSEEGQLFAWDFELPFSQYADLKSGFSADAQADVIPAVTSLELELDPEGQLRLKCGITGQYVVDDLSLLELTEDAYCPGREMTVHTRLLAVPAILETGKETIFGEQAIPQEAGIVTDVQFLPDFPRQRRTEEGVSLTLSGSLQMLYYGEDRSLQSVSSRWEGIHTLPADPESNVMILPIGAEAEVQPGGTNARLEIPVSRSVTASGGMTMMTGAELGQQRQPDPKRPSLILRRAGADGLWEIAKNCDSTMDSIRKANGLESDPAPGQMLLIPITG